MSLGGRGSFQVSQHIAEKLTEEDNQLRPSLLLGLECPASSRNVLKVRFLPLLLLFLWKSDAQVTLSLHTVCFKTHCMKG